MSLLLMTFLPMFPLPAHDLPFHPQKQRKNNDKKRKKTKKKKKTILTTNQGIENGIILLPNLQQGEWWLTANCNHTWNCLGRKEESGKKEAERWERRTEREKRRGDERSTRVKEDGGGQQRRRTDGRQLLISLVGWDFKYSDLPNRVVVLESLFFFLPLPVLVKRLSPRYKILGDRYG
jgi:hypothetical protein